MCFNTAANALGNESFLAINSTEYENTQELKSYIKCLPITIQRVNSLNFNMESPVTLTHRLFDARYLQTSIKDTASSC